MQDCSKIYGLIVVLGFFSFTNFTSASGGSSANYRIDSDTVSSVITENSSSANYSVTQEGAGGDQIIVSNTTSTTTATTTTQVAAASSTQQAISGSGGLQFNLPPVTPSLQSLGVFPIISRVFPSLFGPHKAPRPAPSATVFAPTSSRPLFDIHAISIKQVYGTNEQPEMRIVFDNFGGKSTKVNFTIDVQDASGHEVLHFDDSITVETTGVFTKKIGRLPAGSYHVVVRTQYAESVRDVFRFDFTVSTPPAGARSVAEYVNSLTQSMSWQGWAWAGIATASLALMTILRRRRVK